MSRRLARRVAAQPQMSAAGVRDSREPSEVTGGAASPGGPQVMPLAQVVTSRVNSQYVDLGYRMFTPLFAADGAMVPATGPGRWGQLVAAGMA